MTNSTYPLVIPYIYIFILITIVVGFCFLIKIDAYLIKNYLTIRSEYESITELLHKDKIGKITIIGIICISIVLLFLLYKTIYVAADIPYLLTGNFDTAIGIVVEQDSAGREDVSESRGFKIQNIESDQILEITTIYTPIYLDDVYEIVYLPHTYIGAIVRKIETEKTEDGSLS